jgi:hypothetical protein
MLLSSLSVCNLHCWNEMKFGQQRPHGPGGGNTTDDEVTILIDIHSCNFHSVALV